MMIFKKIIDAKIQETVYKEIQSKVEVIKKINNINFYKSLVLIVTINDFPITFAPCPYMYVYEIVFLLL